MCSDTVGLLGGISRFHSTSASSCARRWRLCHQFTPNGHDSVNHTASHTLSASIWLADLGGCVVPELDQLLRSLAQRPLLVLRERPLDVVPVLPLGSKRSVGGWALADIAVARVRVHVIDADDGARVDLQRLQGHEGLLPQLSFAG
jgi:hypothetical protein